MIIDAFFFLLLPTAELNKISCRLCLSVPFYFYLSGEWLIGLSVNKLHVPQCHPIRLMWRLIHKQTHFEPVYCCKAMVLSRIFNVIIFKLLSQMNTKSVLLGWFWQMDILLNNVVAFALEIKSHKSYLSNLSVLLFCSVSVNIIKLWSNYNASNVTFRTKIVSAFSL